MSTAPGIGGATERKSSRPKFPSEKLKEDQELPPEKKPKNTVSLKLKKPEIDTEEPEIINVDDVDNKESVGRSE